MSAGTGRLGRHAAFGSVIFFSVSTAFPVFLVASLAVPIRSDLGFGPGLLGASVAVYFATTSVLGRPMAAVVARVGTRTGLVVAGVGSSVALLGMATAASAVQLIAALLVAGAANAVAHPAVNVALARLVHATRQGLAFGIKQAAAPAAALFGGAAVPLVALTVGWRWVFVGAAVLGVVNGLVHGFRRDRRLEGADADVPIQAPAPLADDGAPGLLVYAIAAGLGSAGANSVSIFLVDGAVHGVGMDEASAGALYAVASVGAIAVRVGAGHLVDQHVHHARSLISLMLVLGAASCLVLASSTGVAFAAGAVVAVAVGWGWTGVMHYVVVVGNGDRPEVASGALLTGFAFGSASGPLVLGQVADHVGYHGVWLGAGGLCALSAVVLAAASRHARRRVEVST